MPCPKDNAPAPRWSVLHCAAAAAPAAGRALLAAPLERRVVRVENSPSPVRFSAGIGNVECTPLKTAHSAYIHILEKSPKGSAESVRRSPGCRDRMERIQRPLTPGGWWWDRRRFYLEPESLSYGQGNYMLHNRCEASTRCQPAGNHMGHSCDLCNVQLISLLGRRDPFGVVSRSAPVTCRVAKMHFPLILAPLHHSLYVKDHSPIYILYGRMVFNIQTFDSNCQS